MTTPAAGRTSSDCNEAFSAEPTLRFGSYQARLPGVSYVAATDGFVLAVLSVPHDVNNFNFGILQGLVNGNLVASATAGNYGCFDSRWNYVKAGGTSSFLMPVPEGATWQVDYLPHEGSEETLTVSVNWMPLATDSAHDKKDATPAACLDHAPVVRKPWEDFDPAINDLVELLERLFKQELTESEKATLATAMKRLI